MKSLNKEKWLSILSIYLDRLETCINSDSGGANEDLRRSRIFSDKEGGVWHGEGKVDVGGEKVVGVDVVDSNFSLVPWLVLDWSSESDLHLDLTFFPLILKLFSSDDLDDEDEFFLSSCCSWSIVEDAVDFVDDEDEETEVDSWW